MEKDWLIRTKKLKIFGPVSKKKIAELVTSKSLSLDDEICSGNGFWFLVKEDEYVNKYLHENVTQNFNPVSEAEDCINAENAKEIFNKCLKYPQKGNVVADIVRVIVHGERDNDTTGDFNLGHLAKQTSKDVTQMKNMDDLLENLKDDSPVPPVKDKIQETEDEIEDAEDEIEDAEDEIEDEEDEIEDEEDENIDEDQDEVKVKKSSVFPDENMLEYPPKEEDDASAVDNDEDQQDIGYKPIKKAKSSVKVKKKEVVKIPSKKNLEYPEIKKISKKQAKKITQDADIDSWDEDTASIAMVAPIAPDASDAQEESSPKKRKKKIAKKKSNKQKSSKNANQDNNQGKVWNLKFVILILVILLTTIIALFIRKIKNKDDFSLPVINEEIQTTNILYEELFVSNLFAQDLGDEPKKKKY